jgi:curved DNA-binding protein CbpA
MMSDLYQVLGVEHDADHDAIRRAYRRKARTLHPDAGGGTEAFAALSQAHAVLSDPERRAEYDATGQVRDGADNDKAFILEAIDRAFNAVAMKLAQGQVRDMNKIDMLQQLRLHLSSEETRLHQLTLEFAAEIKMLDELAGRFAVADGENYVAKLLRTKVSTLTEKSKDPARELDVTRQAIKELERYKYERRFEPVPQPSLSSWRDKRDAFYNQGQTPTW